MGPVTGSGSIVLQGGAIDLTENLSQNFSDTGATCVTSVRSTFTKE